MIAFFAIFTVLGQQTAVSPTSAPAPAWTQRYLEFKTIAGLGSSAAATRLVALLKLENAVVADTLKASAGRDGVSTTLGEGYSEYYSQLLAEVAARGKAGDDDAIAAAADGIYSPDSLVGSFVLSRWQVALPVLENMSHEDGPRRSQALGMLGLVVNLHRSALSDKELKSIQEAILAGLDDPNVDVRLTAIRAVVAARVVSALPSLRRLAADDRATVKAQTGVRFPVRDEAAKAIGVLQE